MNGKALLKACALLAWAAASTGTAGGDSIRLKSGVVYDPVAIKAVGNGLITFQMGTGRQLVKPLAQVASVALAGNAEFNRGESLLAEGKHAEAVAAFRAAEQAARQNWMRVLISYRLLAAAEEAGQIEEAVGRWLKIADATGAGPGSLALRPKKTGPPRSAANNRAIAALEAKARTVKSKLYLRAIRTLLVDLYTAQGQLDKARSLAAQVAGASVSTGTKPATGEGPVVSPAGGKHAAQLKLAELSLKSKRHDDAIAQIEPLLKSLSEVELPTGLCLLGTAQLAKARSATPAAARPLLLKAGLNLMRVVGFHGRANEAPAALLAAGEVNERLKNVKAAQAAYRMLTSRYGKSPQAGEAHQRLARLSKTE